MMTVSADAAQFHEMRQAMVASQLRTSAVNDARVVAAMANVPREDFVPEGLGGRAYHDIALPLGRGREQNAPLATGRLLTEAHIQPTDSVLLIGATGGYTAAVLARLAGSVVAVEEDAHLLAIARAALAASTNVTLVEGPLTQGAPASGPYDILVIDGAVEQVPDALVRQLRPGGRVVTGIVDRGVTRLSAGTRTQGGFGLHAFADCGCAVLPGFARPREFAF